MITFTFSVMGAGKSSKLIESYNIERSLWGSDVIACTAHFDDIIDDNRLIITRAHNETVKSDFVITPSFDLEKLKEYKTIFIDEAHFLTPSAVRFLYSLNKTSDWLHNHIECYGLLTDFQNNLFAGSQALLYYANNLIRLSSKCEYCNRQATHNIRLVNDKRVFDGNQFVLKTEDHITYKGVCQDCFERVMYK